MRRRSFAAAVLVALACAFVSAGGCGSDEPSAVEAAGFSNEYIGIEYPDQTVILRLADDRTFALLEGVHGRGQFDPDGPTLARGTWSFAADELVLTDGEWTARFRIGRTRVEAPRGADTLTSLRWVTSTEGSPFGAYDLVVHQEFMDFLHPPEGSGSEGG